VHQMPDLKQVPGTCADQTESLYSDNDVRSQALESDER
jgi:hypothetical protein